LLFGLLIFISFLRGVLPYGSEAGIDFRPYFYFFAATLYFMSFPVDSYRLKRLSTLWFLAAGALVLLVAFRWIATAFGLPIGLPQWMGREQLGVLEENIGGLRAINAAQALFLLQAFLLSLYLWLLPNSSRLWRLSGVVLLPVLVLLQHRTVWIVSILSVLLVVLRERKLRSKAFAALLGGVVVSTSVLLGLFLFGENLDAVTEPVSRAAAEPYTQRSTFAWRLDSWRVLLTEGYLSTYTDYLFGKPFGAGYTRHLSLAGTGEWRTGAVHASPHNYYVQTLLRVGIVGLGVLIYVYAALLLRLRRFRFSQTKAYFAPRAMYVLLFTQLIFFFAYPSSYEQGILLGLAISIVRYSSLESSLEKIREHKKRKRRVKVVWKSPA